MEFARLCKNAGAVAKLTWRLGYFSHLHSRSGAFDLERSPVSKKSGPWGTFQAPGKAATFLTPVADGQLLHPNEVAFA